MANPTPTTSENPFDRIESRFNAIEEILLELKAAKQATQPAGPINYLSRQEAADKLQITLWTLNQWLKLGIIKSYRIRRRVLIKEHELDAALKPVKTSIRN